MRGKNTQLLMAILGVGLLAACEEERVPRSTTEFLENPIMLEAAMVRCSQDRSATRYDAECINARQAVAQIEAKEEAARRAEHESRSESKRQALRRTQEAAAQARRRAAESERLREEAEYLAQFGVAPPSSIEPEEGEQDTGNLPVAVIPPADDHKGAGAGAGSGPGESVPATDGGNAPVSEAEPEDASASDLSSTRDELQERNDEGGS